MDSAVSGLSITQQLRVSRKQQLQLLLEKLERAAAEPISDEHFGRVFRLACETLELADAACAEQLKTSRPTIHRWKSGRTAPHAIARASVIESLVKMTRDRIAMVGG